VDDSFTVRLALLMSEQNFAPRDALFLVRPRCDAVC
jgi:hypothetical protein